MEDHHHLLRQDQNLEDQQSSIPSLELDVERERYPFCIVWTPIPVLTYLLPFVGHMGLADSRGITHDFAGPYTIGIDNLAFGKTTRYLQLVSRNQLDSKFAKDWDECLQAADQEYSKRMHNLCCDNCHSHVAFALNRFNYRKFRNWNMIILAAWIFFAGRFVSTPRLLCSILPSMLFYGFIYFMISL